MTTYRVDSEDESTVIATWTDLPIKGSLPVGPFAEAKMATTAKSVLNAASRYRWHRALQLLEQGIFTEEEVGSDAAQMEQPAIAQLASDSDWGSDETEWLPRLPTSVVLGDSPMSEYLGKTIEGIVPDPVVERPSVGPYLLDFTGRVPLGNLRPLLWRDWSSHLSAEEHACLAAELDADAGATTGLLVGRERHLRMICAPGSLRRINSRQIQSHLAEQLPIPRAAQPPEAKAHNEEQQRHHGHHLDQGETGLRVILPLHVRGSGKRRFQSS